MRQLESQITITPDPQILQVLTYLEMRPINSLCELIDNSIDALMSQHSTSGALILINLPTKKEIDEGTGLVHVRDNGPGMTLDQLENSLRAGYSSKPRLGNLGLFGVGFNIASGKLGQRTRVLTARKQDDFATETSLDLVSLKKSGNFTLKASRIPKPEHFEHGTIVEVSNPWGSGNQNYRYMSNLVSIGRPKILTSLGRTYATILQAKKVRIMVGEDTVEPFVHCIWDDSRFVEHAKRGRIPAVQRFNNKVIHTYRKCAECSSIIPDGESVCPDPNCRCQSSLTQEEKITGWIGIQRYLDSSHFGIDLIRNGRAIRTLEKEPFFTFKDPDSGSQIVDYPVDNREGRIVGELHLDHVPVDPAKQNFEQSSPEWRRVVEFIRGNSSLQPEQPGADGNSSPLFMLYQGYRKVRTPGRRAMTMGKWLPGSSEPRALSRSEIDEMKAKFDGREPGYFQDTEWWKLVEQADQKPIAGLKKCPGCNLDQPEGVEECSNCGHIFDGKECINLDCKAILGRSAASCQYCGANQIPEVKEPWICAVCTTANSSEDPVCVTCNNVRGTPNPVSRVGLLGISHKDERLSFVGLTVPLASGVLSTPIDLSTYLTANPISVYRNDGTQSPLPSVRFADGGLEIFLDPNHELFVQAGIGIEFQVATEVASYLHVYHQSIAAKYPAEHSITKLTHGILKKCWPEKFSSTEAEGELQNLFDSLRLKLADAVESESSEVYGNLSQDEKNAIASELVKKGRDFSELSNLKDNGKFVHFLRPRGIVEIFRFNPKLFFDRHVWDITFNSIASYDAAGGSRLQDQIKAEYGSLLDIVALYAEKGPSDPREADLVIAATKLLSSKIP